jgi:hypothetical protein
MDLNSKSIGLVLSGGGSKGIAHAGAIKFLEQKHSHSNCWNKRRRNSRRNVFLGKES